MTHTVTEACIKCKYTDCVDVCPVDCFREGPNFLTIDPDECIDCAVNPSATEICDDLDNNCDGEADVGAVDAATWYQDADTDGYGDTDFSQESCDTPEGYASEDGDCDDAVASTNPGASMSRFLDACDDVIRERSAALAARSGTTSTGRG